MRLLALDAHERVRGETLTFGVGVLDMSDGGFPANHLREHMATSIAVTVTYTEASGDRVAVRLVDAK